MTIITITLAILGKPIVELCIDGIDTTTNDEPDTLVVKDANVINWDNQPEP